MTLCTPQLITDNIQSVTNIYLHVMFSMLPVAQSHSCDTIYNSNYQSGHLKPFIKADNNNGKYK
jgi:hypothetical protein